MIRYFAKHPNVANLLMIVVFLLGFMGASQMIRETLPEFSEDKVVVQIIYKGATAEEVETSICTITEEAIEGLEGIGKITSKASEGVASTTVEMKDNYDFPTLYRDIKNEVDQIDNFPEDAEDPIVYEQKKTEPVITVAIASDLPFRDLKEYGELIRKELLEYEEVSLVELQGFSEIQIKIKISEETLRSLNLNLAQVKNSIAAQSQDLPIGSIESKRQDIIIRLLDQKYSPQEFGDLIVIAEEKGSRILLSDIAKIEWELEKKEDSSFLNSKRAVILSVKKSSGEDALVIREKVISFVDQYQKQLPEHIQMVCIEDAAQIILDRLNLLTKNGLQGLILVFLVLWILLDLRLAFWVSMGIPFAFLGALWLMNLWGLSLNMITMVSLIIGIGLIVDDAIVIGENIYVHLHLDKKPLQACVDGALEVAPGVVCSFLTTIAAFMPLIFMEGQMGKVLGVMPIGVILALGMSVIEAFFILPNHLTHSFEKKKEGPRNWFRQKIEAGIHFVTHKIVKRIVRFCLRQRYLTCMTVFMTFLISLGFLAGGRVEFIPFPELDGDVIICYTLLPAGTPLSKTEKAVSSIEAGIWQINQELKQPGNQSLIRNVKVVYGNNRDAQEAGSHVATITVELLTSEIRSHSCDEIMESWRNIVGQPTDVTSLKYSQLAIGPAGKAFEIQLTGKSLQDLSLASRELQGKLFHYEGVYNISDNLTPGKWEIQVVTTPFAKTIGLSSRDVFQQLNASFFGGKAQEFVLGKDTIEVKVQLTDEDRNSLDSLENFYLSDPQGKSIPLTTVVDLKMGRGYTNIYHVNGKRSVTITADIDTRKGNASKILAELRETFLPQLLEKYDLKLNLEGQAKETAKTGASARQGLIIGLIAIFVILAFIFRSYAQPLTIMATIPLGFTGAIFGHYIMGLSMSMPSMVGAISLCGIVVNDSIVLVQFLKENVKKGMPVLEAAAQASVARFRAVFITSATTIAGLLPLIVEKSLQAQVLIPLAVSIAFGLLFATILVLVFIPCLTGIFYDFGWVRFPTKEE